ncbi:hypothetical protein [Cellulomonas sp. URHD0024]|uniref:hypothetical protein n=1 Tax=Cellulomonas sp. URHD0024 TaxID=1302620 RepID=UPI00040B4D29|nr:hypothetical protein [Cellulomonas sp. URHD0024]
MWNYLRARRGKTVGLVLAVAFLLVGMSSAVVVSAPFQHDPIPIRLVLLSPVLTVVAFAPSMPAPAPDLEAMYVAHARRGRTILAAAIASASMIAALVVLALDTDSSLALAAARNGFMLDAALLLAVTFVSVDLGWVAPVVLVAVTYVVGLDPLTLAPRSWAFLLAPANAASTAIGILALGVGSWAFVRQQRGEL